MNHGNFLRSTSGKTPYTVLHVLHGEHYQIHHCFVQSLSLERGDHVLSLHHLVAEVAITSSGIMGFQPISGVMGLQDGRNKITPAEGTSVPLRVASAASDLSLPQFLLLVTREE